LIDWLIEGRSNQINENTLVFYVGLTLDQKLISYR